jgi:polysaccharide export outer membrane protein
MIEARGMLTRVAGVTMQASIRVFETRERFFMCIAEFGWRAVGLVGIVFFAIIATSRADAQGTSAVGDYRLHPGDKLEVSVWKELEMQKPAIVIRPDGKFSFPLVGEIVAAGRSAAEIRVEIETRLKKYVPEPVVTVGVVEVGGNVAYVIGQVGKPGVFIMNPAINVLQALSLAGGTTPFAKLNNIVVIRTTQGGQRTLSFHYDQVSSGKALEQNVNLESGDVVVVP